MLAANYYSRHLWQTIGVFCFDATVCTEAERTEPKAVFLLAQPNRREVLERAGWLAADGRADSDVGSRTAVPTAQ